MERGKKELQGDLDNIVLMALRKEPSRRYTSVEDLSNDIERYLNGLPITARPNTFFYRASKFYSRNKTASIFGLFLILTLIAGIIATTWQAVVARRERDRAEKRFQDVRKLSNSLLFEITPKIERLEGSTEAREILVKRALEYLDSLSTESQNDLTLQSELATAYEKVGDVQGKPGKANIGDLQGGINSYAKAQKIRILLAEKNPNEVEPQRLLAANYNSLGDFHWWASNIEGAMNDYEKSIGILEKLLAQDPDNLQLNLDLLNSVLNRIKVISYNGNYDESIKQYRETIQKVENLESKFPNHNELQRIKAHCLMRSGYDLSWQNRYDILDEYVKKSLAIYEPLIAAQPNDLNLRRDLYFAYFQAGGIYVETNNSLSRQYLEKSAILAKGTVENDKFNYQAKHDLAQSYSKIGEVLQFEKKYAEAVDYLHQAEKILTEISVADPRHDGYKFSLANNYARLAAAQEGKQDFQNAVRNYQKCIEQQERLYQTDLNNNMPIRAIAVAAQDLGKVFEKLQQSENARHFYRKSVEWFALLEQKGAISDYDRKNFENSRLALERLLKK
jgi:non-specific serine/threonine protein kinase/serine/threonine-protein kinase